MRGKVGLATMIQLRQLKKDVVDFNLKVHHDNITIQKEKDSVVKQASKLKSEASKKTMLLKN